MRNALSKATHSFEITNIAVTVDYIIAIKLNTSKLIASRLMPNIISKENKFLLDQSKLEELVQTIESLQISLEHLKTDLRDSARQVDFVTSPRFAESDSSAFTEDPECPSSKWGFTVGDKVRITNSVRVGNFVVPNRFRSGTVEFFTSIYVAVNISYRKNGNTVNKIIYRSSKNITHHE